MKNLIKRPGSDVFYVRKKIGDKTHRVSTGETDRKRAERRAIEILRDLNDDRHGWKKKEPIPSYDAYAQRYQDTYSVRKLSPGADDIALRRSMDLWQEKALDVIVRSDCAAYINWRMGGARPGEPLRRPEDGPAGATNTILHECTMIGAVFNAAMADKLLTSNPWKGLRKPSAIHRTRTLTLDQQALIADGLTDEYQRLLTCYLGTGLRADEMHKLEPADIDVVNAVINLPKHKAKGKKRGRVIPLFPLVLAAFTKQIELRASGVNMRRMKNGGHPRKHKTAIFNMSRMSALQVLQKAARDQGAPDDFTLHDLRRTFGTRCAEAGMPIKHLSVVMGHSNIQVTSLYYIHIGDDNMKATLLKLDLGLAPALPSEKVLNFEKKKG